MRIKDFLPAQTSLYKYIWKIVVCIIIIDEKQTGPDIWPENFNQSTAIEDMTITI